MALLCCLLTCGSSEGVGGAAPLDLEGLTARGTLRVLTPPDGVEGYRGGTFLERERAHAARLAEALGLEMELIELDRLEQLIPALLDGTGDLAIGNLTRTRSREEQVSFSMPVTQIREQVVTRSDGASLASPADLVGREVAVLRASSNWESVQQLRQAHPGIEAVEASSDFSVSEVLERVASGELDVTIADANLVSMVRGYRPELHVAFELPKVALIAWAMRPQADQLREAVDRFLSSHGLRSPPELSTDDLTAIRDRGVLRVLTTNNAANYYVANGRRRGFEYELVREFARRQDLALELVVPPAYDDLMPWLLEGRADLVAASLTAAPERARAGGVVFSARTNRVTQVVIALSADPPITSIEELAGRRFHVRRSSHYWKTLEALRAQGTEFELRPAPEHLETEEIVGRVADGRYDLTLADSHIAGIELTWRDDVSSSLSLGDPVDHAWALRPSNPELIEAVNAFLTQEYRGTFYNVVANRYFDTPRYIRREAQRRPQRAGTLSPYDSLVYRQAMEHGFDWRLIVAQMFQESRFDPQARSAAGARGLLQLMPRTARQMGIERLEDPEAGITAGVQYLAWQRDLFGDQVQGEESVWFALAAYNVGRGHVRDAQLLAKERDLAPDRWFGHVERALLLKRRPAIASTTRFGWCRADETVRYVREIRDRYRAYVGVANSAPAGDSESGERADP